MTYHKTRCFRRLARAEAAATFEAYAHPSWAVRMRLQFWQRAWTRAAYKYAEIADNLKHHRKDY